MLWHIGHVRVSVSPHICATHIRGPGQFSGLSLPAGRKTHLDPSWVTPLRPWPTLLDKLTTIIPPSLFVSPDLLSRSISRSPVLIVFLSRGDLLVGFFSHSAFLPSLVGDTCLTATSRYCLRINLMGKRFLLRLAHRGFLETLNIIIISALYFLSLFCNDRLDYKMKYNKIYKY